MVSVSNTGKEWQLVLNAHILTCPKGQTGSEPVCSSEFATLAWEVQHLLLELLNKINGKVMQLLVRPLTFTTEDPNAWRFDSHSWERIWDCKIVRMHACGLYFSTRKPVDYQQRVGPLRTRRKGYRHLAGEGRPDFSAFLEEQTSKMVATSLCGSFNQTGRLRTSYHKRHWKLS